MKSAIFLVFFLALSCNNRPEKAAGPGEIFRTYDPVVVDAEELSRLKVICDALESKEGRLPSLISSRYTFTFEEKKCDDHEVIMKPDQSVTIQRPDYNYIFRLPNGDAFAFPDVETSTHGAMAVICSNINDLRSPIQVSPKGAIWFSTFTGPKDCASDFDSMCVHIQRGEHISGRSYDTHTEEWIKFKVRDERTGFFVERKLISRADCPAGKYIEKRAKLK